LKAFMVTPIGMKEPPASRPETSAIGENAAATNWVTSKMAPAYAPFDDGCRIIFGVDPVGARACLSVMVNERKVPTSQRANDRFHQSI
jgi:hypothetical protein